MSGATARDGGLPPKLNLGCGEDVRDGYHNVDAVDHAGVDEVVDLDDQPWPWPDGQFESVLASHVLEHLGDLEGALRECSRVLAPGGRLEVRWPMGLNEVADPDHGSHRWRWRTPEFYCGARAWDVDVGLSVVDRDCDLWSMQPLGILNDWHQFKLRWKLRRYGAGPWCFDEPNTSGEFTVVFQK